MKRILAGLTAVGVVCALVAACSGDKGDTGPAGSAGTAGTPGSTGASGTNGTNGTNGTAGATGEAGAPGGTVIVSARAKHGLDISPVAVATGGMTGAQVEQVGQGSYLVNAVGGCGDCHNTPGATLKFLGGGNNFPLGGGQSVNARNLTPDATTGMKLTEAQFIVAMQTGRDHSAANQNTTMLFVMPWQGFRWISTGDLKAIYAYLKAIPAVSNAVAADTKGNITAAPLPMPTSYNEGTVIRPLPPEVDGQGNPIPDPNNVLRGLAVNALGIGPGAGAQATATFGRGSYLVNAVGGCNDCHTNHTGSGRSRDPANQNIYVGEFLTGGGVFATPAALQSTLKTQRAMSANLIGDANGIFSPNNGAGQWSFQTFVAALTQGVHADDPTPQAPLAFPMPWRIYRNMTIDDLAAVYDYLTTLASGPAIQGASDKITQETAKFCNATADCDQAGGETCNTTAHECVLTGGGGCNADNDCRACQTCNGGNNQCEVPATNAACLTQGR